MRAHLLQSAFWGWACDGSPAQSEGEGLCGAACFGMGDGGEMSPDGGTAGGDGCWLSASGRSSGYVVFSSSCSHSPF